MAKKPTGARPMPKIPKVAGHSTPTMNKTKPAVKHTSMPSPKGKHGNRSNPSGY